MKARHIYLTDEAVGWFKELAAGRKPNDVLLSRGTPIRRKVSADRPSDGWRSYDQKQFMAKACQDAGIEPVGFHELRHTYASHLVNRGVPLAYVAAQLGHADTRMVMRYYGHLAPSAMAEAIRKAAPRLKEEPLS
jgi:integrase